MASSSSNEDVFVIAALAEEEERQRSVWVHGINEESCMMNFVTYTQTCVQVSGLLHILQPVFGKQNTKFRRKVSGEERLAVRLMYITDRHVNITCVTDTNARVIHSALLHSATDLVKALSEALFIMLVK
ncbi:hypothetical protein PR048_020158 [Dryococelus australis]|uniref:Uncharacterized protein n=1 Tax=Dryococelus australis TaxID=614101 RepID=A0ABQ9H5M5_9NEOP|nr:hypothetical protein PR048_020158 [Dryococelus australis]